MKWTLIFLKSLIVDHFFFFFGQRSMSLIRRMILYSEWSGFKLLESTFSAIRVLPWCSWQVDSGGCFALPLEWNISVVSIFCLPKISFIYRFKDAIAFFSSLDLVFFEPPPSGSLYGGWVLTILPELDWKSIIFCFSDSSGIVSFDESHLQHIFLQHSFDFPTITEEGLQSLNSRSIPPFSVAFFWGWMSSAAPHWNLDVFYQKDDILVYSAIQQCEWSSMLDYVRSMPF